jgi:hypothetical protein
MACTTTPRDGATPSTNPTATATATATATPSAIDFSRIFLADLEAERWQVEHGISLPQALREQFGDGFDGVARKFPAATHGITAPFTEGDRVALVTDRGTLDTRVTGLGAGLGGGQDWLYAVLEPAALDHTPPSGRALAVFGPHPHPDARLEPPTPAPLGPRVDLALATARAELPALTAELANELVGEEDEDARAELTAAIAKLGVGPECCTTFAPALAPGFDQLLVVQCGNPGDDTAESAAVIAAPEAALSGIVMLGEHPQLIYPWNLYAWSLELRATVDLDGDGIDELWIEAGGHEWYTSTLWRWDGQRYVEEEITSDSL